MLVVATVISLILMALTVRQIASGVRALILHDDGRQTTLAVIVVIGGFGSFLFAADSLVRLMLMLA